jgi:sulfite dehydrogenase (cytochrome) subunit A
MIERELDRRAFLRWTAAAGVGSMMAPRVWGAPTTQVAAVQMARFPQKRDLILLTDRPPNLETPIGYFRDDFTPNSAFFVRWHHAGVPTSVDPRTFRLSVKGHVATPLELSLAELREKFEPVTIASVAQCAGNSRSFFQPRIIGAQWGNGAMGNAKWTGVRLKDLLDRAAIRDGAVDVSFAGLDEAPLPDTPKFAKSLDVNKAGDQDVIVAYAMNDTELPMLNGYPLRLIVPGWYATYWVKSLNEIRVLSEKFKGFWMEKAYRIPTSPGGIESPTDLAKETVPISTFTARSVFVRPEPAERIVAGKPFEIEGLALDSGKGIVAVAVSTDGGKTWSDAKLDREIGKFAWRRWRYRWKPPARGRYRLMAKATNAAGETQTTAMWNRSGYQRNVIEQLDVNVS